MDISLDDLASALIRLGFYFPSQRNDAEVTAKDIFFIIEHPDPDYLRGAWHPEGRLTVSKLYDYIQHPHIVRRKQQGPIKVADVVKKDTAFQRFNSHLGLVITTLVGTMMAGYIFAVIALISLPAAIGSGNLTIIIAWVSSNFLQLVLLPIIIVGQNIQAKASDARADQTYNDAEAVLAEALKIQEHLAVQDAVLTKLVAGYENPDPR